MRIIAGEFRGRALLGPETDTTRPITDRAKQSLFDILAPRITESVVYDLFSGTGSMGLECLSRGAKYAAFFECDRSALTLLKKNIATFEVEPQSRVVSTDIFTWFGSQTVHSLVPADLIFLDPPYRFLRERALDLQQLARQLVTRMQPAASMIFRHDIADHLDLPPLIQYDLRSYGGMTIELLSNGKG